MTRLDISTNLADAVRRVKEKGDPPVAEQSGRLYTVVEKILGSDESLPADWPVQGTTGYDFLNSAEWNLRRPVGRLLPAGDLRAVHRELDRRVRSAARQQAGDSRLVAVGRIVRARQMRLDRISEQHRLSRDFTRLSLYRAVREVLACFPVYRTYIRPEEGTVRDEDRRRILRRRTRGQAAQSGDEPVVL